MMGMMINRLCESLATAYAIKFFTTSEWINLLRSALQLVILGIVINRPIDNPFLEFIFLDLQIIANIIIAIVATLIAIDFLKSLIILGIKALRKKTLTLKEEFKTER